MLSLYLATLVFGGLFVAVSIAFGGHDHDSDLGEHDFDTDVDHDLDHDVDVDVDHDLDHDAAVDVAHDIGDHAHDASLIHHVGEAGSEAIWLPFLSLRFWTFALMSFGMMGTILQLLVGITAIVLPVALITGFGIGTGAAYTFRRLKSETVTADTGLRQYVGSEARVLLAVRPGRPGKIVVDTLAGQIELVATTKDGEEIPRGQRVLVTDVAAGEADVTRLDSPSAPKPPARQRTTS